jgi:hypothetical protein
MMQKTGGKREFANHPGTAYRIEAEFRRLVAQQVPTPSAEWSQGIWMQRWTFWRAEGQKADWESKGEGAMEKKEEF